MPRYEFTDSSSSKFWEITQNGSDLHLSWGKIGSSGQSQIKNFADTAKATKEYDKLVREKTGKGYVEVGTVSVATAPVAAPVVTAPVVAAPVVAAPVVPIAQSLDDTLHLSWPPDLLSAVLPRPGWPLAGKEARRNAPTALWKQALVNYKGVEKLFQAGESFASPESKALFARVLARYHGQEPTVFEPEFEGASWFVAYALGDHRWHADHGLLLRQLENIAAQSDFLTTFKIMLYVSDLRLQLDHSGRADGSYYPYFFRIPGENLPYIETPQNSSHFFEQTDYRPWALLRRLSMAIPAEERQQALELCLQRLPSHRRNNEFFFLSNLALLFPEHLEFATQAHALQPPYFNAPALLCSQLPDVQLLKLLELANNQTVNEDVLATAIYSLGLQAFPLVKEAMTSYSQETRKERLHFLRVFAGAEIMDIFIGLLSDKHLRGIAVNYIEEHGALALPLLEQKAKKAGKQADPLLQLAASIRRRLAPQAPQAVAPAEALPLILQNPPWRQKKGRPSLPSMAGLQILPGKESIDLPDKKSMLQQALSHITGISAERLAQARSGSHALGPWEFLQLDDALLRECWPNAKLTYMYEGYLNLLMARLDIDIIPRLVELVFDFPDWCAFCAPVRSARMAPAMALGADRKKTRAQASRWLLTDPEQSALGLIPVALAPAQSPPEVKRRRAYLAALRLLDIRGYQPAILSAAAAYSPEVVVATQALLDFDPLYDVPAKAPKLPDWWDAGAFASPCLLDGRSFPATAVDALGEMLAFSPLDIPYPGIAQVRAACDAQSLDHFVQSVAGAWVNAGASTMQRWAFFSLALLGSDDTARWIAGQIDRWVADKSRPRVQDGLDALAALGTDRALMWLGRLAYRGRQPYVKEDARKKLAEVAEARGLTMDELEDRSAPDLGLHEDGSLILDFGPRQFRIQLDESLRPQVLDMEGHVLSALPRVNKQDDAEKAKEAWEHYKALKEEVEKTASHQLARFERSMVEQRRWSTQDFLSILVPHPLLFSIVRRLVWGVYQDQNLLHTFRVAEDRSLADASDSPFELPEDAEIGLVHPMQLDENAQRAWSGLLADYALLQPFEQLSRMVYHLNPGESINSRCAGMVTISPLLYGLLAQGWALDGDPYNGTWGMAREVQGVRLYLHFAPPLYQGQAHQDHTITHLSGDTSGFSAIVVSELIRSLESLRKRL